MSDAELDEALRTYTALIDLILRVHTDRALAGMAGPFTRALAGAEAGRALLDGLRHSPARAAAITSLASVAAAVALFDPQWIAAAAGGDWRANRPAGPTFQALSDHEGTLEGIVRVRAGLAGLPEPLREPVRQLLVASADPEAGAAALRHAALEAEINRRLADDPSLQTIDGTRLEAQFDRYRKLAEKKMQLVRDCVRALWVGRQKERLLAGTGSRLNSLGADLRRRLTLRGERAMRLRKVIDLGRRTEGGDPLLDLCPVWMVSPETAAQIFPREPVFDAVVFDEASQCRLEEALPVLTRGGRVVIAGDPQQLPPTRFFESTVTRSEDEDPETDQELFETQQGEVEDLLGAALGLDIRHCYLDVHYRSRSAELIAFSNEHFYADRLQPIPHPPSRRAGPAPVKLYRADGVYDKRRNEAEADKVCEIVKELLNRRDPPSIGVACFNLPQRDLIVEKLDELAGEDPDFAGRLEAAQLRTGAGSFEGLFVKNLENVQGDERDHVIISTTYGPDESGRFYRRFGPVGRSGGGRRLNVLVTRARERVHLVTSIPQESYRTLPPVPQGQTPGGAWLLFAYLKYAEQVSQGHEGEKRDGDEEAEGAAPPDAADGSDVSSDPVRVHSTRTPSAFAEALARRLAAVENVPSDVYWGNEGFCVDLVPRAPEPASAAEPAGGRGGATAGVLCDTARYPAAEDPVEWDVFRTAVLEGQGWQLHRVWAPHFFRDPTGATDEVAQLAPGLRPRSRKAAKRST